MKKIILLAMLVVSAQSFGATLLFNSYNKALCGDYLVTLPSGEQTHLKFFRPGQYDKGLDITLEQQKIANFLNGWFTYFDSLQDPTFKFNKICFGLFNDMAAAGPNAYAWKGEHFMVGTEMIRILRHRINQFVNSRIRQSGANNQVRINSEGATNFLYLHELSHIIQMKHKAAFTGPTSKMSELNADCIAAYLYTTEQTKNFNRDRFFQNTVSGSLYAYALGDYDFTGSDHHGTYQDRAAAYAEGMRLAINDYQLRIKRQSLGILNACYQTYR